MEPKKLSKKFWKQKAGAVGIGTLIVFIAMILVAAVAAVVLIRTSGVLEQKAYEVGSSATAEASNKMKITSLVGTDGSGGEIGELILTILPSGGSAPIDLNKVKMTYQSADVYVSGIQYSATTDSTAKNFTITSLQGDGDQVLESVENDILELHYQMGDGTAQQNLTADTTFTITLIPMEGAPAELTVTTPASIQDTYVPLYP
jgi:flagellin FlaB